ncbi:MAG: hypothetical protein PVJ57_21825 [Phycisphaerae bacterium]|jgi:hypothetical protein
MARQLEISEREFKARWRKLPEADRQFVEAIVLVNRAVSDERLCYHELSPQRERSLRQADRDTVFSILTECLGILTNAPAMQRVRKARQQRGVARVSGTESVVRRGSQPGQARR